MQVKWCPRPGCDNSVKCDRRGRKQPVTCACGFSFCFQCAEADIGNHLPATCAAVKMWNDKNKDESENVKWLMANTKRCPKCQKHIEKSAGCMHMTCRKEAGGCGHEFCWLCRGPWSEHGSATGGYYACMLTLARARARGVSRLCSSRAWRAAGNKYDSSAAKKDDLQADQVRRAPGHVCASLSHTRSQVKTELDEYMFYYHRFNAHRASMAVAAKQAKEVDDKGARLQKRFDIRPHDTRFLCEAVGDLAEQRRVLMWSYCYGYALKREGASGAKEYQLYEDLQEQVEKHCDALSGLYERNEEAIKDYNEFIAWKADVINRHKVVQKFVQRFVEDVGSGLAEERFGE